VQDFEEWLRRVTTLAVDTEINVQLGEFTLKKNPMQLLPDDVFAFEDFQYVIGKYDPERGDALQCAEVNNTQNRQWWRLVGKVRFFLTPPPPIQYSRFHLLSHPKLTVFAFA